MLIMSPPALRNDIPRANIRGTHVQSMALPHPNGQYPFLPLGQDKHVYGARSE